jgi:sec-independent protein translocase protein TatC
MSTAEVARPGSRNEDEQKVMTVLEHLQELRTRLVISGIALLIAVGVSFYPLSTWALEWLRQPAEARVDNFELIFTKPLEYWTTYFRVSLFLGFAIAMPVLLWQLLSFVGPGLTGTERRWAYPIIAAGSAMFLAGCAFAYYIELPPAIGFLLGSSGDIARPFISIQSYVDFATRLMLVTGLVFETPLVIMGLAKVGVVDSRRLFRFWRLAIVGSFVVSAIVTPSIDPVTQSFVAGPMIALYFVGILLAKLVEKRPIIPRA